MIAKEKYLKLVDVLESEVTVYRHLLDVIRREHEILVSPDIEELNSSNQSKEAMVNKLKLLEKERERVARELAHEVGADTEEPRLLELALKLEQAQGDKLRAIHSTLQLLLKRIKDHNLENENLVQAALQNIHGAMNAIRDSASAKATYQKKGKMEKKPAGSGRLVSKSV